MAHDHARSHHRNEAPVSPLLPVSPLSYQHHGPLLRLYGRSDAYNYDVTHPLVSPIMSRSPSVSSDRYSAVSALSNQFPSNPTNVSPAPSYVAAFGAAQVLSEHNVGAKRRFSNDDDDDGDDDDDNRTSSPATEDAQFSEASLVLLNGFLDQLLFSFLSCAQSTDLFALRPAVKEVLRSRLASEAIASADEELQGLLAGGDDEEQAVGAKSEQKRQWDLELVWKRTRLRVMVYIRLGEMEDEDEQRYVSKDGLFHGNERRFSSTTGLVSWAAAIFLTSILEYVAEQVIQASGEIAYSRARRQSRNLRPLTLPSTMYPSATGGVTVEDYDMEKVALNSLLGRLWRSWRKSLRNNHIHASSTLISNQYVNRRFGQDPNGAILDQSRNVFGSTPDPTTTRPREHSLTGEAAYMSEHKPDDFPDAEYPEHILAANIPLPVGDVQRDVEEIEVPGLARDPDEANSKDTDDSTTTVPRTSRRNSLTGSAPIQAAPPIDKNAVATSPYLVRPGHTRQRSRSVPTHAKSPLGALTVTILNGGDEDDSDSGEAVKEEAIDPSAAHSVTDAVVGSAPAEEDTTPRAGQSTLIGSTVAGVSAAAATVASLVYGTAATRRKSGPPIHIDTKDTEELDKQKHLPDIKLLGAQSGSSETVAAESSHNGSTEELRAASLSSASTVTAQGDPPQASEHNGPVGPEPVEMSGLSEPVGGDADVDSDAIGVAKTSDTAVLEEKQREESKRARDANTRRSGMRSRPTLASLASRRSSASRERVVSTTVSANASQERLAQLASPTLVSADKNGAPSPTVNSRRSSGASEQGGAERPPWRRSVSAAIERSSWIRPRSLSRSRSASESEIREPVEVKDHPIIKRISSLRENGKLADGEGQPLTSANIRGPEDFEMFVQGGDTVHYTLTPEQVRGGPDATDGATQPNTTAAPAENAPSSQEAPSPTNDTRAGRSQSIKQATSADDAGQPRLSSAERAAKAEKRRSISRPPVRNTSVNRRSGLIAREPQVQTESTRDIVDFIRSTGPSVEAEVVPLYKNRSTTSLHSFRDSKSGRSQSPGGRSIRSLGRSTNRAPDVPPLPAIPLTRGKQGMQPRDATSITDDNSALIDFIRTGPADIKTHRISRTVAPFRTTMDSDQMGGWRERGTSDTDRGVGARSSSATNLSTRTSINSRAPLLNGSMNANEIVHPAHSGRQQSLSVAGQTDPAAGDEASRQRYRNKDPYPIDMSDDDDDLLTALPKTREEESLIDFLRNSEPPSARAGRSAASASPAAAPPQKASGGNPNRRSVVQPFRSHGADIVAGGRRPSLPSSLSRNLGSAHSTTSTIRSTPLGNSTSISGGAKPKMEARSPGAKARDAASLSAHHGSTKDLADFLRSSGPPPSALPTMAGADSSRSAPAPHVGRFKSKVSVSSSAATPATDRRRDEKTAGKRKSIFSGFALFSRSNSRSNGRGTKTYLDM